MSSPRARPRRLRFVDVTARGEGESPAWLLERPEDGTHEGPSPVAPLVPPEVPSHARPPHAPLLESVIPPPGARPPSQFPSAFARSVPLGQASRAPAGLGTHDPPPLRPSELPGSFAPSRFPSPPRVPGAQHPSADLASDLGLANARRRDTMVEDLVPRAEEEAVAAIQEAVARFGEARAAALEGAEKELVELVKLICRRVVLREVTLSSSVVEALVQEGLSALGRSDKVHVRLGPFFADALDHISDNLHHQGVSCSVSIDPTVGMHGCVLETELGRVDESVEARLDVLLASLDTVP